MIDWTSLGLRLVKQQKGGPWIPSAGVFAASQEMMPLICPSLVPVAACAEKNTEERRGERSAQY